MSHFLLQGRPLTTRARWLNAFIFAQFGLVTRLPQLQKTEKPIYILGTGRSGTTILGRMFSLHPQVNFLNEPKALWHVIYHNEDLIGSYTRSPAYYCLDAHQVNEGVRRRAHRLYGYSLAITHSKRIVDKYPEMIFRIPFLQAIFPDAKFVFITRNGLDTSISIRTWSDSNRQETPGERHDWWGVNQRKWRLLVEEIVPQDPALAPLKNEIAAFTRQEDMAAVEWIATMRQGMQIDRERPGVLHTVRYEDLVSDPRQTLSTIFRYCDLAEDEVALAYAEHKLSPRPPKPSLELDPAIEPIFNETMNSLGYSTSGAP